MPNAYVPEVSTPPASALCRKGGKGERERNAEHAVEGPGARDAGPAWLAPRPGSSAPAPITAPQVRRHAARNRDRAAPRASRCPIVGPALGWCVSPAPRAIRLGARRASTLVSGMRPSSAASMTATSGKVANGELDPAMHGICIPVTPDLTLFELATPCEVFGPRDEFPVPWWYQVRLCAVQDAPVRTAEGLLIDCACGLRELNEADEADTVIVPAPADTHQDQPAALLEALRAAYDRGARIASICTGAFTLAAAGLLDGRRAATHWMHAAELACRWPAIQVDPNVLYADDGQILTSAGVAAGLDLCLHIVRHDHGTRIANTLARRLVIAPHREGGQAQYIEQPLPIKGSPSLGPCMDWARAHLELPLTVEDLAGHALMSSRTFARRFRETTGTTPLQWLCAERVRRAQDLLENTDDTVDRIADACGLGSAHTLRTHFIRINQVTPREFRRTFRSHAAA